MRIIVTGSTGTIGKELMKTIESRGHTGIPMGRNDLDVSNEKEIINYLNTNMPDAIMHLAKADDMYTKALVSWAKENRKKFLFTSSYKVFSGKIAEAPYQVYDRPDGNDEFALYKTKQEDMIFDMYPDSHIVRLAWQIGTEPGGYNMLSFIKDQMDKKGIIQASKSLYLSAMFLSDTVQALVDLIEDYMPGMYHLEANDGYSFYDVIYYLKHSCGHDWIVLGDQKKFAKNDLMDNTKVKVKMFSELGMIHHS